MDEANNKAQPPTADPPAAAEQPTAVAGDQPTAGDTTRVVHNYGGVEGNVNSGPGEQTNIRIDEVEVERGNAFFAPVTIDQRPNAAPDPYDVHGLSNPYLGLATYTYEQRNIYAGREPELAEGLDKLVDPACPNLLFVIGASGSGKSSFVQAGLIPKLEAYYQKRGRPVSHAVFRPARKPLTRLDDALYDLGLPPHQPPTDAAQLITALESGAANSVNVLVIDQFEELFTQADDEQRDTMLKMLTALMAVPFSQLRTHVVATMRVDYLKTLFDDKHLFEYAMQGTALHEMDAAHLSRAILRPLEVTHPDKQFEPLLLQRLVADTLPDAAFLPLLQVTLEQLWKGGSLRSGQYRDLTAALQEQACSAYEYDVGAMQPRPAPDRAAILDILLDLVKVSPDGPEYDVRRSLPRSQLVAKNPPQRNRLIDDLLGARLLSSTLRAEGEVVEIDVIHETLIHNWEVLKQAIEQNRQQLQQRTRFNDALAEWQAHQQDDRYLITGVRLEEARNLDEQHDTCLEDAAARTLLQRSLAAHEAEQQQQLHLAKEAAAAAQLGQQVAEARAQAEQAARLTADTRAAAARTRTRIFAVAATIVSLLLLVSAALGVLTAQQNGQLQQQRDTLAQQRNDLQQKDNTLSQQNNQLGQDKQTISNTLATQVAQNNQLDAQKLAFAARSELAAAPQSALILAAEAVSREDNPASEQVLRDALDQQTWYPTWLKGTSNAYDVWFSPDGRYVAIGERGLVHIWPADGSSLVSTLAYTDTYDLQFSADDKYIVSLASSIAGPDQAQLWDMGGHPLASFTNIASFVNGVEFSPSADYLLVRSIGAAQLQDMQGKVISDFGGQVDSAQLNQDGSHLITRRADKLSLWDSRGQPLGSIDGVVNSYFTPDGNHAIVLSANQSTTPTVEIRSLADGRRAATLSDVWLNQEGVGGTWQIPDFEAQAGSRGNQLFVTTAATNHGVIQAWNISGQLVFTKELGSDHQVTLSPDARFMVVRASSSPSGPFTTTLYDSSGKLLTPLNTQGSDTFRAVFSPDGQQLLTLATDGSLRLWNTDGSPLPNLGNFPNIISNPVYTNPNDASVGFSPDSQFVMFRDYSTPAPTLRLWNRKGQPYATLAGVKQIICALHQARCAVVLSDGTAALWTLDRLPQPNLDLGGPALLGQFSSDGKLLLTGGESSAARLWSVGSQPLTTTVSLTPTLLTPTNRVKHWLFCPTDTRVLAVTIAADTPLQAWDSGGKPISTTEQTGAISWAACNPNGELLAVTNEGLVKRWDKHGQLLGQISDPDTFIAAFSPNDDDFITVHLGDAQVVLWNSTGTYSATIPGINFNDFTVFSQSLSNIFSADGKNLLTISGTNTLNIYDLSGKRVGGFTSSELSVASFSPDGSLILGIAYDQAYLWQRDGKLLASFRHNDKIVSAVFSPDGTRILTAGSDKVAQLWDRSGHLLGVLRGHSQALTGAVFSPDGRGIVTFSADGTARQFAAQPDDLLQLAGCAAGRTLTPAEQQQFGVSKLLFQPSSCP